MQQWLIVDSIKLVIYSGMRYWFMNDQQHRDGGDPAYENVTSGYCQWYEHNRFVRDNW